MLFAGRSETVRVSSRLRQLVNFFRVACEIGDRNQLTNSVARMNEERARTQVG